MLEREIHMLNPWLCNKSSENAIVIKFFNFSSPHHINRNIDDLTVHRHWQCTYIYLQMSKYIIFEKVLRKGYADIDMSRRR
jgi:hypothetical protein